MRLFVLSAGCFAPQMLGRTRMLIDSLTFVLEKSGALDDFWGKLDAGTDATLGVASSARSLPRERSVLSLATPDARRRRR